MTLFQVFLWFCKDNKMMRDVIKIYQTRIYGDLFKRPSLSQFLEVKTKYGMLSAFFYALEYGTYINTDEFTDYSENYKKGKVKWRYFLNKNVILSEDYIKIGDTVRVGDNSGEVIKIFTNDMSIIFASEYGKFRVNLFDERLEINGVKKEPSFIIKRKRKIYGTNKG